MDTKDIDKLMDKLNDSEIMEKCFKDEVVRHEMIRFVDDMTSTSDYILGNEMFKDAFMKYWEKRRKDLNELIKQRLGIDMIKFVNDKKEPVKN